MTKPCAGCGQETPPCWVCAPDEAAHTWPPELRPALALEALRNAIAQAMWDDEQRRAGLTSYPLHLATLHRDEYRAHADVVMRVVGPWVAAEVVAAEGRGVEQGRREMAQQWVEFGGGPVGLLLEDGGKA